MREKWLDQIRGIAIIMVVTEHLMGIVHHTEAIQVVTLFCTSVLVICMGITQTWGYQKAFASGEISKNGDIVKYLYRRMLPIICMLCLGTIVYMTYSNEWIGLEVDKLLTKIINCDAVGPFYFFRHYINLTLLSPVLYFFAVSINSIKYKRIAMICNLVLLLTCFAIGYWSVCRIELLGRSYLFLYSLGMVWGGVEKSIKRTKNSLVIGAAFFLVGIISTIKFYWARLGGNFAYAEGLNSFTPNLQLNPPNVPIIIYSIGCFVLMWYFFKNNRNGILWEGLSLIGQYSLDIFVWHPLVIGIISSMVGNLFKSQWLINIVYYIGVLGVPVGLRMIYNNCKKKLLADK